jgi:hypothetical protein
MSPFGPNYQFSQLQQILPLLEDKRTHGIYSQNWRSSPIAPWRNRPLSARSRRSLPRLVIGSMLWLDQPTRHFECLDSVFAARRADPIGGIWGDGGSRLYAGI